MYLILIIDDEKKIALSMKRLLTRYGYTVVTAHSGKEGVRKFFESEYDLVITDICMPMIDGYDVIRFIRSSDRPDTPVIGISGTPSLLTGEMFSAILKKPFSKENLLESIDSILKA